MIAPGIVRGVLLAACFGGVVAKAQGPLQPVTWTITAGTVQSGGSATVDLTAKFDQGWHVYGLNQAEGGPTPLRISADPNAPVQLAGTPFGSVPVKQHDKSFDLDTETFVQPFTLHIPLRVKPHTPAGEQEFALNVRFQACNDRVCLPPKTVHLTAVIRTTTETP